MVLILEHTGNVDASLWCPDDETIYGIESDAILGCFAHRRRVVPVLLMLRAALIFISSPAGLSCFSSVSRDPSLER